MGTQIKSPCISDCRINEYNMCIGCGRTVDQIVQWATYSDSEREVLLKTLEKKEWPGKRRQKVQDNTH